MIDALRTRFGQLEAMIGQLFLQDIVLLVLRLWLAKVFFMSGLVKIADWTTTIALFADEYKVPVLPPELAATLATAAELSLPVLLVAGLLTRYAAVGLMAMTLVIELLVYPGTTEHYYWMMLCATLIVFGSGRAGADYWIGRRS